MTTRRALRLVGRNSSTSAELVREGELEAALVSLPIDDRQLVVEPVAADDVVFVSADHKRTTSPVTIEHLADRPLVVYDAESGDRDPLRRQLAKRAQEIGVRLNPRIETQTMVMALRFVAMAPGTPTFPEPTPEPRISRRASTPRVSNRRSPRHWQSSGARTHDRPRSWPPSPTGSGSISSNTSAPQAHPESSACQFDRPSIDPRITKTGGGSTSSTEPRHRGGEVTPGDPISLAW